MQISVTVVETGGVIENLAKQEIWKIFSFYPFIGFFLTFAIHPLFLDSFPYELPAFGDEKALVLIGEEGKE